MSTNVLTRSTQWRLTISTPLILLLAHSGKSGEDMREGDHAEPAVRTSNESFNRGENGRDIRRLHITMNDESRPIWPPNDGASERNRLKIVIYFFLAYAKNSTHTDARTNEAHS